MMHNKTTRKNIRGRRRGAGIEMAMLLMLVTVALSGLITSAAMMQINKQKGSEEQLELLEQRMWLDQIGRDFCAQRDKYVLPQGVTGGITYDGSEENPCPGCCNTCAKCNEIYAPPEDDGSTGETETDETPETDEGTGETETGSTGETEPGGTGTDEGTDESEGAVSRPVCCKDCAACTTGCTGFDELSLVVYNEDSDEILLTVVLKNNKDGTYTVTEWSYG